MCYTSHIALITGETVSVVDIEVLYTSVQPGVDVVAVVVLYIIYLYVAELPVVLLYSLHISMAIVVIYSLQSAVL